MTQHPALKSYLAIGTILLVCALIAIPPTPLQASSKPVELGATLFHTSGCEHCHGADGRGGDLGPDLSTVGKRLKKPQIEHQIHDGGGGMPAFAEALQPDEITALVAYLHTRRKAPKHLKLPPSSPPSTPSSNDQ